MDFTEYQIKARETAIYPGQGTEGGIYYCLLGLGGEVGECLQLMKKLIRDREGVRDDEFADEMKRELGDCLWYISQLSAELGLSLDDVAITNSKKLEDRQERNQLQGDGSNR